MSGHQQRELESKRSWARKVDAEERDNKERGPPSAKDTYIDEYVVRGIERSDPSYRRFPKLLDSDPELSRIVVKHRFGGTGDGASVKITAALVRQVREARARSGCDAFEREEEIWDARNWMAFDKNDGLALDEYIGAVVGTQFARMIVISQVGGKVIGRTLDDACLNLRMTTIKRWPRIRPHWRRFQRRLCHNCPACAHLGEPRYMVCSGCGMARYCSEKCQREHWPWHQEVCLAIQAERRKKEEFERQIREAVERQADAPL